jgi:hypothetical protein
MVRAPDADSANGAQDLAAEAPGVAGVQLAPSFSGTAGLPEPAGTYSGDGPPKERRRIQRPEVKFSARTFHMKRVWPESRDPTTCHPAGLLSFPASMTQF